MTVHHGETRGWQAYKPVSMSRLNSSCIMNLLQDSTTVKFRHFESNSSEESPVLGV